MKKLTPLFCCLSMVLALQLSGCATNTSELSVDTSNLKTSGNETSLKTAFIREVVDDRQFRTNLSDPSSPSTVVKSDTEKDHSIGRKRNTYGKALGKLELPKDQGVRQLTKEAIVNALVDDGYRVLGKQTEVTPETVVVDVKIKKFWLWMNPGFWAITLSGALQTDINLKSDKSDKSIEVNGSYGDGFQTGMESNWKEVLQKAYDNYCAEAREKIKDALE